MVRVRYSVSQLAVRIMRKNSSTSPFSPISTNTCQLTTLRHTHVLDLKKNITYAWYNDAQVYAPMASFFPDEASVTAYPVNSAFNSQVFESALPSGHFWIRYESGIAWTLIRDMFLSSDLTTSSPVLYHEYSRRCWAQWVIASTLLGLQFQERNAVHWKLSIK